jgi:DNA-3-methyladenine glycosylase II
VHYKNTLSKDKLLRKIIASYQIAVLKKKKQIHLHLCLAVTSQQLRTKVADLIYQRFLALFDTKYPTPASILAIPDESCVVSDYQMPKLPMLKTLLIFSSGKS